MTITPRTSRAYRRRTGLLALAALVLLMLLRAAAAQASSPLPDSHAGRQMSWFLEASKRLPIPEAEVREHFAPGFLALPGHEPAEVNAFLATLVGQNGLQLRRLLQTQPDTLVANVTGRDEREFAVLLQRDQILADRLLVDFVAKEAD